MFQFGNYIISDPKICHGKLVFRGTRIFVEDVLEQVEAGMDWQSIINDWDDSITKEAISEAVRLARNLLTSQTSKQLSEAVNS